MKPRDYCCCAIPTVNAGIYATLIEQFLIGILVGALSVATPRIVGAATPTFAPWILAIICFVAAGVQVLGFIGVSREKPTLYRRYVTLHGLITAAAFAVAAAWAIISAVKHNDAQTRCIQDWFGGDSTISAADTLCNIFPWVDVGIMGGLWVILAIFHVYLFIVISSYGAGQRQDHQDYDRINDPSQPLTKGNNDIPLSDRNDTAWDAREDYATSYPRNYTHVRQNSSVSATDVLTEPVQQPIDDKYQNYDYNTSYQPYTDNTAQQTYDYNQQAAPTAYTGYTGHQDGGVRRHSTRQSRS
ncbi:hypothetical protein D9611_006875 [Ephemerocybe angulata]|uniref:Uncharacterized protein n=1 Tax=Ephemerocybe angulata TaxID=980116 RepID=A0A8H5B0C9_9AGAR|nr:hypothetical protein D9611_006875 [Tulosesus angulatus]